MKFKVYRETKSLYGKLTEYREPKVLKTIEADDVYSAAEAFWKSLGKGWRDSIIEVNGRSYKHQTANLWVRKFTPTGRYKGETHFMVWPA